MQGNKEERGIWNREVTFFCFLLDNTTGTATYLKQWMDWHFEMCHYCPLWFLLLKEII